MRKNTNAAILLYVTTKDVRQAKRIAKILLAERRIACANIIPSSHSLYFWEGKLQEGSEAILLLKTTKNNYAIIEQRITEMHSYKCPCILLFEIGNGKQEYLDWLRVAVSTK